MSLPRVFFAHRFSDQDTVRQLQHRLRGPGLDFVDLAAGVPVAASWKDAAGPLIDTSDALVCSIGETTHASASVEWEARRALAAGRPVFIAKIDASVALPKWVGELGLACVPDEEALAKGLRAVLGRRAVFNTTDDMPSLLGQYSLIVTSWETLINRRQSVNQLYLGASAALVTAGGGLVALAKDVDGWRIAAGCTILSALGLLLCWNWWRTIRSYGILSMTKARVVAAMEEVLPVRLFGVEWTLLQTSDYQSTTKTDQSTITLFMVLFALVATVSLAYIAAGLWK